MLLLLLLLHHPHFQSVGFHGHGRSSTSRCTQKTLSVSRFKKHDKKKTCVKINTSYYAKHLSFLTFITSPTYVANATTSIIECFGARVAASAIQPPAAKNVIFRVKRRPRRKRPARPGALRAPRRRPRSARRSAAWPSAASRRPWTAAQPATAAPEPPRGRELGVKDVLGDGRQPLDQVVLGPRPELEMAWEPSAYSEGQRPTVSFAADGREGPGCSKSAAPSSRTCLLWR